MKKINILVFGVTSVIGGTESYLRNLIHNLNLEKYNFDFMVVGEKKASLEDELNEYFADGKNHFFYPPNMKKSYFTTKKWLKEFYRLHNYDLIYMNVTSAARIVYCKDAINNYGAKLITHNHCGSSITKMAGLNNYLYKFYTTKKSDKWLACSEEAFKWGFSAKLEDGLIIKNGIDLCRFKFNLESRKRIRDYYNLSNDRVVIGHIGRFSKEKNHEYFINLAKLLNEKYVFMLIGEGALKNNIVNKIKEEGLEDRFIILPFTEKTEEYYCAMDLFMMPSLYEGLPIVSVEAQASGLPCLFSSRISKQADISENNIYFNLEDIDFCAELIKKNDLNRRNNADILNDKGFDIKSTANIVEKIFEEVL